MKYELEKIKSMPLKELQDLYNFCTKDKLFSRNYTGTHALLTNLEIQFKDCVSITRRELYKLGIQLEENGDLYWIKRNLSYWESPEEAKQVRISKIRNSINKNHKTLSEEDKNKQNEKRSSTLKKWYTKLDENDKSKRSLAASKGNKKYWSSLSDEEKNLVRARKHDIVVNHWNNLDPKVRALRCKDRSSKVLEGQIKAGYNWCSKYKIAQIGNKEVAFSSTWEYHLYCKLLQLNVTFSFANENSGNVLQLKTKVWNPDFIVNDTDIIEVKGHPKAKVRFFERDLPEFLDSDYKNKYSLWVLFLNIKNHQISSYQELLNLCVPYNEVK
jgi:hypothetical protein